MDSSVLGNILLGIVSFVTFISYFPQTVKLIKTKKSRDLSIYSWMFYIIGSFCYTLYAILVSHDGMFIFQTCLELFFCILILSLAIIYRKND